MLAHHALKMLNRRTGLTKSRCEKLIETWNYSVNSTVTPAFTSFASSSASQLVNRTQP